MAYAQPGPQITASVVTTPKITRTLVTATSYGTQSLPRITRGDIKTVRERLASPILSILHTHEDTFHHHCSISSWICSGGRIKYWRKISGARFLPSICFLLPQIRELYNVQQLVVGLY